MVSHSPAKSTRSSKQSRQSTRPRCTPAKYQEVPPTPTKKETAEARKKAAAAAKKKKAAAVAKKKKAAAATVKKAATAAKKKKKETAGGGKKKAKNNAGNKLPAADEGSADVIRLARLVFGFLELDVVGIACIFQDARFFSTLVNKNFRMGPSHIGGMCCRRRLWRIPPKIL